MINKSNSPPKRNGKSNESQIFVKKTTRYLAQNVNWGHHQDRIGIWKFLGKGKTGEKISGSKDENQQQPQPTYDTRTGNRTRATLVGGEYSHQYAIPARFLISPCSLGIFFSLAECSHLCSRLEPMRVSESP